MMHGVTNIKISSLLLRNVNQALQVTQQALIGNSLSRSITQITVRVIQMHLTARHIIMLLTT